MRKYTVLFLLATACVFAGPLYLKQSTAVSIAVGPFTDDADGKTLLSGPTVTGISMTITKSSGTTVEVAALAATGTANDLVIITTTTVDCMGMQELQATDVDTLGGLTVIWYDADQIFPIKQTYWVVSAEAYSMLTNGVDATAVKSSAVLKIAGIGYYVSDDWISLPETRKNAFYPDTHVGFDATYCVLIMKDASTGLESFHVITRHIQSASGIYEEISYFPAIKFTPDTGDAYSIVGGFGGLLKSDIRSALNINPN